jgi:hypothetical protein
VYVPSQKPVDTMQSKVPVMASGDPRCARRAAPSSRPRRGTIRRPHRRTPRAGCKAPHQCFRSSGRALRGEAPRAVHVALSCPSAARGTGSLHGDQARPRNMSTSRRPG